MESRAEDFTVTKVASRSGLIGPAANRARSAAFKRIIDLMLAGPALFFMLPFLLLIALAIKLDSRGPVLFWQTRRGLNGKPFKIIKFRTMTVLEDGSVIEQATRGDRRVTRLGRMLRRLSIDELPQLLNVLKGEMSLVGPRPHALAHDEYYGRYIEHYPLRHNVKPGITGWAQINGSRGETPRVEDMRRRIELDIWYVRYWSVGLDIKIIFTTALQIIRSPNAF
jgi:exopolysaccharide biosynthesis polyprenyl glycosylphosphotransferase